MVTKMISGQYRSEQLCRFWSNNTNGYCLAPTCSQVLGDLEHLLLHCPALGTTRSRLYRMWNINSKKFPELQVLISAILQSTPAVQVQFILNPTVFPELTAMVQRSCQGLLDHVLYMTRTFAFALHRASLQLLGRWPATK